MPIPRVAFLSFVGLGALGVLLAVARQPQTPEAAKFPSSYVDTKGAISLPSEYRLKWTHLGSWSVTEEGGGIGLHDVYAQPDAVTSFIKDGKWPDGATIVKEVRGGHEAKLTTGQARWDGEIKVWFVMVKDAKHSFPDNPNWGRGWDCALYNKSDPTKNVSTNYKLDCIACHVPAQETDWIYLRGYPTLNEKAGPFGTYPATTYQPADAAK